MQYSIYNLEKLKGSVNDSDLKLRCRKNTKDFTRDRKITPRDLIFYTLNNRGKTTKMELYDFINEYGLEKVSTPALLKQREKLNENIFKELNKEQLLRFYDEYSKEVKNYNGYVLGTIDGSDCEVPNTIETRERYKSINVKDEDRVARIKCIRYRNCRI